MTDQYGYETSWSFTKQGGTDPLFQGPDGGGYNSTTLLKGTICVDRGIYVFQIKGTQSKVWTVWIISHHVAAKGLT